MRMRRPAAIAVAAPALVVLVVLRVLANGSDVPDNAALAAAVAGHQAEEVTVQGQVTALLPDSVGSDGTHERFDVDFGGGLIVEIDHNTTLAPRVPVTRGTTVLVHGQFEPDPGHPIIHYTHHATGTHPGGWIEVAGRRYQ